MSLKKSATRRLSLLAGSSLVAAGLCALAPTAALAQATCTSPAAPAGNGTTAVTIAAGTYDPGVTCAYVGAGSTVSTAGAVTVSTAAGGNGVNLSATGAGVINWNSSAGTLQGSAQTNGPIIDAVSESGAINITTGAVNRQTTPAGSAGNTITVGIKASSTAGGAVNITTAGVNIAASTAGTTGIEATSTGGAINITTTGNVAGRARGIVAQTSGTGTITLTLGAVVSGANADGVAGLTLSTGSGAINITSTGNSISSGANGGKAIIATTTGNATVNINAGTLGSSNNPAPAGGGALDFSGVGGISVVNLAGASSSSGRWLATGTSTFGAGADRVTMSGVGVNMLGAGGAINFGAGNDTFNMSAFFGMGAFNNASMDFGAGTDVFNMSGVLSVDGVTITGLETFNSSGVIYLGAGGTRAANPSYVFTEGDGFADEVMVVRGTAFTGSGSSRIVLDALLGADAQAGCDAITLADCLDLRGGSTAGSTLVTVNYVGVDAELGAYNPVGLTVVDVNGGTSAASHFTLDSNSTGYVVDPIFGGALDRPGLFRYALHYDPATQRHALVGVPRTETMEYAILSGAAQSVWHLTADTVIDRQGDLRNGAEGGSLWMRAGGEYTKRRVSTDFESFGDSFAFDNSYKLYAGTIIGGMDLAQGRTGPLAYVVGVQAGYVGSSFSLDASPSTGRFTGATGGIYASLWNPRFFLDAALNANGLTLDYGNMGLGSKTNTYLSSIGGRVDAGTRVALSERAYVEPLASFAYARTSFEEISLFGGEIQPADAGSLRAALGARLGADVSTGAVNVSYFVLGRAWEELDGDNSGVVKNPGAGLPFADDVSGGFGEAEAGLSLYNSANTFSGFVTGGVKFKDGFTATNLSAGVRMAW